MPGNADYTEAQMQSLVTVMRNAMTSIAFDDVEIPEGTSHMARYEVETDDGIGEWVQDPGPPPGNWYRRWSLTDESTWAASGNEVADPGYAPPFGGDVEMSSYIYEEYGLYWRTTVLKKCRYRLPLLSVSYGVSTWTQLSDASEILTTSDSRNAAGGSFIIETPMSLAGDDFSAFAQWPADRHRERHLARIERPFP
jgi:hypothetical protein